MRPCRTSCRTRCQGSSAAPYLALPHPCRGTAGRAVAAVRRAQPGFVLRNRRLPPAGRSDTRSAISGSGRFSPRGRWLREDRRLLSRAAHGGRHAPSPRPSRQRWPQPLARCRSCARRLRADRRRFSSRPRPALHCLTVRDLRDRNAGMANAEPDHRCQIRNDQDDVLRDLRPGHRSHAAEHRTHQMPPRPTNTPISNASPVKRLVINPTP